MFVVINPPDMKRISLIAVTIIAAACGSKTATTGSWDVCPLPQSIELKDGTVTYKAGKVAEKIDTTLGEGLEPFQKEECYRIEADKKRITITAATPTGILRARQTLAKAATEGNVLPSATIWDYPQFSYRAFMLDSGRHFFPVETVKEVLDILALHQINVFHWHLTEDQGWRIEIKKYPRLTEIGSMRAGDPVRGGGNDGIPHGGFYTQDEIREVVSYAAERGIDVVPEVDLPGHMQAALASYPELGCTGGPYEVSCEWGVRDDVLCAGKEGTLGFVKDVLTEVMELFPSKYIHIGGDECPKVRWEKCPACQAKIRALGIKADGHKTREELLQSWFMDEVSAFVEAQGRRCIAWNDPLVDWDNKVIGAPSKNTVIAGWMRPVSTEIALREGYDAILCPVGHLYLSAGDGNRLKGDAYLHRIYDLDVPEGVLGVEACLWSERVSQRDSLLWRILPRIGTVSELQWSSPEAKDFDGMKARLSRMRGLYETHNWPYNDTPWE